MKKESNPHPAPRQPGFFRAGWRELGRKIERSKLRKRLAEENRQRDEALVRLGQLAWQGGIDLSPFAELRQQLSQMDAQAGELTARAKTLETQIASLEDTRRAEAAKFDSQRQAIEEKKRPVDASLRAAREKQDDQDRKIKGMEARLARLAAELAALDLQPGPVPGSSSPEQKAQIPTAQNREQLLSEQAQLSDHLPGSREEFARLAAEVNQLGDEAQRYAEEISKVEAERKAALSQVDAGLSRLRAELGTSRQQASSLEQARTERFRQLGLVLYERKIAGPSLAEGMQQIASIDLTRAAIDKGLEASLAETRAMPRGTMLKFSAALLLVPLLLVAAGYGIYFGWDWWSGRQPAEETKEINPYLTHPLTKHPAYVLANQLAAAKSQQEVADSMLKAFQAIGIGVYTGDGKQISSGAERSEKDFFLYDFHWRILARAFHHRNIVALADFSPGLGKGVLELDDPSLLAPILSRAMFRRYQAAVKQPNDPMNFLILLVDGLARQQLQPYSLGEIEQRPSQDVYLDPLQAFLILLDFFTRPTSTASPATTRSWLPLPWHLVPTVHADSLCDAIQGDGQGYWGRGTDVATDVAGELGGAAGKVGGAIGGATGVIGAVGDLLILYGIDVHVIPTPDVMHLLHDEDFVGGMDATVSYITTTVTFDAEIVSDEVLKCGWMAGKKMPVKGPLKDVELTWDFRPVLPPYLEMDRDMTDRLTGHLGLQTKTDEKGESTFLIKRKNCPAQKGKVVRRKYKAIVTARTLTREIPTPGFLGLGLVLKLGPGALEYLMGGRKGYADFHAEWHEKKPKEPQYGE